MALGTLTKASPNADSTFGNKKIRVRDVQLTAGANYITGGDTITPALAGMRVRIEQVIPNGTVRTTTGGAASLPIAFDLATTAGSAKMQVYVAATGAEQAAGANLSTFSVRCTFIGV
jgi:hypothetical protein